MPESKQGKWIQVTRTGVVLPLILLVFSLMNRSYVQKKMQAKSSANVDASILALNANVKWTHAGDAVRAFLVAVSCPKTVPGEKFVAAGNSRHFARAYHGECMRVCTLLNGVYTAWLEGCEHPPPPHPSHQPAFLFFFCFVFVHRGLFSPNSQMNRKRMSLTGVFFFSFLLRYLNWNLDCEVGQENFPRRTAGGLRWRGVNVV